MNRLRPHDDAGQVTVFVVTLTVGLLFAAGLVIDGGRLLTAKREAANVAEHAARAGAQHIAVDQLRAAGIHALDPAQAAAAARRYLAATGHDGDVSAGVDAVTVAVTITTPLHILRIAGPDSIAVTGTATAHNRRGVSRPEP